MIIPKFYFPKNELKSSLFDKQQRKEIMEKIAALYDNVEYLTENDFINITTACTLPRYMNLALFRAIDTCQNDKIAFIQFQKGWKKLTQGCHDFETLFYNILKKHEFSYITPDDFLPVLEDVVLNHPALQFLEDNMTFQERYIETVICRIFYDANCPTGKMTLNQFKKSGFSCIIKTLDPMVDLYTVYNLFSYKQFYVIYCKLWSLDADHDLLISEDDLFNYNMGTLTHLVIKRITQVGHISAFSDTVIAKDIETRLSYFDFIWFLLSEIDKATPMAIDYWFKCLDLDGDGVISSYELHSFWDDQDIKQRFYGVVQPEGIIRFEDIIRQMNDLIQPRTPGQFLLSDLKKNRFLAERFFDTFINFDRFQVHEAHQEGSIREQQDSEREDNIDRMPLTDDFGLPVLSWNEYADAEYCRIVLDEKYANSYDGEDEERPNDDEGLVMSLKKIISDEEESDSSSVSSTQSEHALLADKKNIHELLNITQNETTDVFQS